MNTKIIKYLLSQIMERGLNTQRIQPSQVMFVHDLEEAHHDALILDYIIGMAEVLDCGSIGGYGEGQRSQERHTVQDRLAWLRAKYE